MSEFLFNVYTNTIITEPIHILVDSSTFEYIYNFMTINQVVLESDYDYEQIRFTDDQKLYIKKIDLDVLVEMCSAANYLDYKLLMECTAFYIAEAFSNRNMAEVKKLIGGEMTDEEKKIAEREFIWLPEEDLEEE
ncbi:hypothetical protein BDAP_002846 [Binucleata daphniae]